MNKRVKKIVFILFIFGSLVFGANYFVKLYQTERYHKIMAEYESLSCENMKAKFEIDLKHKQLKYFSFGMFEPQNLNENLKDLNIENFHQGCVLNPLTCYNKLVENHILKSKKIKIKDLY